jgi:photosystem I reaction center subunit VIII
MLSDILPSIFVPFVGLVLPAITMAFLFIYIEEQK